MADRPRLLDLFCGAGGAAMGYSRAGFDVVGVDIQRQPNYPFDFWHADAMDVLRQFGFTEGYDAIHASPPCQAYTSMNNRHGSKSPALIGAVRTLLERTKLPYVIENVLGARWELVDPVRIVGSSVGLGLERPRLFETNWPLLVAPPADRRPSVAVYGKDDQRRLWTRKDGSELRAATLEQGSEAMGIDWMTWNELREAIPPAYTELIGHQLMQHILQPQMQRGTP